MKIVEYNDSYAAKVAVMWNKSNSSWGNEEREMTKEDVIAAESNSGNIKLYLATENDEVVGYCSFSEYRQDEGASYLPLLNVVPEYHGKKVGKALILKVLENAIESKWPRFDLYTWSGNIKAMPLYKKCGFFWEKNNTNVHLMNFLPYLYQSEALEFYLSKIDTYNDSKREIKVEHDGEGENGFEFYRYDFENDKTKLAFEFEKSGRGLRYIDTPDYEITMTIENQKQVYGKEYQVQYVINNKRDKALDIRIEGVDNKNIQYREYTKHSIETSETVTHTYYVDQIEKDQLKGKTHPTITSNIIVKRNDKISLEQISNLNPDKIFFEDLDF